VANRVSSRDCGVGDNSELFLDGCGEASPNLGLFALPYDRAVITGAHCIASGYCPPIHSSMALGNGAQIVGFSPCHARRESSRVLFDTSWGTVSHHQFLPVLRGQCLLTAAMDILSGSTFLSSLAWCQIQGPAQSEHHEGGHDLAYSENQQERLRILYAQDREEVVSQAPAEGHDHYLSCSAAGSITACSGGTHYP